MGAIVWPHIPDIALKIKVAQLAENTDKIVVYNTQRHPGEGDNPKIVLTGNDVKDFFSCMKLKAQKGINGCSCLGQLKIKFYSKDKLEGSVTCHHFKRLRGKIIPFKSDVNILPPYQQKLKELMLKKGIIEGD
ncbi:MAG: hypothetical protein GY750_09245 [Lentisphaerae bacterium]|nr:hypothetical protein [Lentisphaerota bacterium]MCP4101597.1 hypothetical protein [Lentisphaerota bacterium]